MASSALETLVYGAVLNAALCVAVAAPLQAVDCSVPVSSASFFGFALCLWDGLRMRHCKVPASGCRRPAQPAFSHSFSFRSVVAASIVGVPCQQHQRLRDGVAAARDHCASSQRDWKRSAGKTRMSSCIMEHDVHRVCVSRLIDVKVSRGCQHCISVISMYCL